MAGYLVDNLLVKRKQLQMHGGFGVVMNGPLSSDVIADVNAAVYWKNFSIGFNFLEKKNLKPKHSTSISYSNISYTFGIDTFSI